MSSTVSTFTSNWFKVKYTSMVEDYIDRMNETAECYESGECFTVHHRNGQIRITAYDVIDQSLGFYEDDEQEYWIDVEEEISTMLEEGEVFRITSLNWFKGRLESMFMSTYTWDGRQETRSLDHLLDDVSQKLEIDSKKLKGWN